MGDIILIIIGSALVYFSSAAGMYKYIRRAHSPGGRWENIDPSPGDRFYTFCPIINTMIYVQSWFMPASKVGKKDKIERLKRFYKITNEN